MKRIALLSLVALAGCAPASSPEPAATPAATAGTVTAFRGRLIDGTGAAPIEDGVVVVDGDRIRCAGRARDCRIPDGVRVVDADGGTLLPGLIDMHVHVWDREMLSMFLPAGVTTVRDLHNTFETLAVLDTVSIPVPRLFRAGPLIDGRRTWPGAVFASTPEAATAAVDSVVDRHVDFVKLYNGLTPQAFAAAAGRARQRGARVTADLVGSSVDAMQAMAVGVEGFEHAGGFAQAYRRMGGDLGAQPDSAMVDSLARTLVRRGAYLVPTFIVMRQYGVDETPHVHGVPMADRVSPALEGFWNRREGVAPEMRRLIRDTERFNFMLVRRTVALGGRVGAGSDLPNPYVTPGGALHQELELLVESGLTPLQAIHAATGGAAEILRRDDLGVLAAGKVADLVVVGGNPAAEITATRDVKVVVHNGRVMTESELLALAPPLRAEAEAAVRALPAAPAPDATRLARGTLVYRLRVPGDTAGVDSVTVVDEESGLTIAEAIRAQGFGGRSTVRLAGAALRPVNSVSVQEMQGNRIETELAYEAERVRGRMALPAAMGGEQRWETAASGSVHDLTALPWTVAALPLTPGADWTLPVYNPYVRRVVSARVEVAGMEDVQVGGATVRAFRVTVDVAGYGEVLWISEAQPRWLVAMEVPGYGQRRVAVRVP